MATKLSRVYQLLYMMNGSASHCGQFGSKAAGVPFETLDPAAIQALSAFLTNGWTDAVVGANKQPFLEDMNGLFRVLFYQLCQIFQDGIPVWDPSTAYFVGSVVRKDGTFEEYGSLTDSNIGNPLPNQTANANWTYLNPPTTQPGIISDFAGPVAPFGYLLCDGTAYPQSSFPALFTAIGSTWNTFNGAASPGAGNFRVPDLRSLTTIGVGQGTGFSNRTLAQLVGEETHVLVVGEMPSHTHGITDPGHHHVVPSGINMAGSNNSRGLGGGLTDFVTNSSTTGNVNQNTGGGGAHNNMQPSAAVNKVIKT